MSTRALTIIAAAAVLLGLLAFYGHRRSAMSSGPASGALLLPELESQLNDIDQIRIEKGGQKIVATLKRTDKGWTVSEKSGYPADVAKIRKALIALSQAKIVEQKTSDPKYYDRLGVEPIKLASASGTAVTISGPDHPPPPIILGGTEGSYRYARLADQDRSYLVDKNPELSKDTADWLDTQILDVPGKRVEDVTIRHAGGETLKIGKKAPDDTNFTVADVPKGRQLLYPGVANVIGNSLHELKLQDVAQTGDDTAKPEATAVFRTFDGLVITAEGRKRDGKPWVTFAASVDPQRLPAAADQSAPAGGDVTQQDGTKKAADDSAAAKSKSAGKRSAADIRAEAKSINSKVSGWQYQIPTYQYDQMTRRMSDLLKAEQKAKKAAH
jgi:hypothetical protein